LDKKTRTVLFSSTRADWQTPRWLFDLLNEEFRFTTDVGATCKNRLCEDYLGLDNGRDALFSEWGERNFCNPPYSRGLYAWIRKAYEESQKGKLVVLLIPARTDVAWFHDFILDKAEIRFLRGRLKFSDSDNSAPFPSMICIFNEVRHRPEGKILQIRGNYYDENSEQDVLL
jgi:site-specific DNA-methyltransferase (adenine-specific)